MHSRLVVTGDQTIHRVRAWGQSVLRVADRNANRHHVVVDSAAAQKDLIKGDGAFEVGEAVSDVVGVTQYPVWPREYPALCSTVRTRHAAGRRARHVIGCTHESIGTCAEKRLSSGKKNPRRAGSGVINGCESHLLAVACGVNALESVHGLLPGDEVFLRRLCGLHGRSNGSDHSEQADAHHGNSNHHFDQSEAALLRYLRFACALLKSHCCTHLFAAETTFKRQPRTRPVVPMTETARESVTTPFGRVIYTTPLL